MSRAKDGFRTNSYTKQFIAGKNKQTKKTLPETRITSPYSFLLKTESYPFVFILLLGGSIKKINNILLSIAPQRSQGACTATL